jgi:hypothetical protein
LDVPERDQDRAVLGHSCDDPLVRHRSARRIRFQALQRAAPGSDQPTRERSRCGANAYADSGAYGNTDADACSDAATNGDTDTSADPGSYTHTDAYACAYTSAHADSDADTRTDADSNADPHRHADAPSDNTP